MPTFTDFRDGRGGELLGRAGLDISRVRTWREYTDGVLRLRERDRFLRRVEELDGCVSSTERIVLHAALTAADFDNRASNLDGGVFWRRVGCFDQHTAASVAAVILRRDDPQSAKKRAGQAVGPDPSPDWFSPVQRQSTI